MIENSSFVSMLQRASVSVRSGTYKQSEWFHEMLGETIGVSDAVSSRYRGKISSF